MSHAQADQTHPKRDVQHPRSESQQPLPEDVRGRIISETGFAGPQGQLDTDRYRETIRGSRTRDQDDSKKDREAMTSDRDGIVSARDMRQLNNEMIAQLNKNGKLTPELLERAKKVYGKYVDSLKEDHDQSQVYSGTQPLPQERVDAGIKQASNIGDYAKELAGSPTPERRAELLHLMSQGAAELQKLGTGDQAVIGKDAADAGREATNIQGDVASLAGLTPGSPQYKQALADIQSKVGLIGRELGDIKDERGYISQDDQNTQQANEMLQKLQTLGSGRLDWKEAFQGIIQPLQQVNKTLGARVSSFRDDLKAEPGYIAANNQDIKLDEILLHGLGQDIYRPERR